MDKGIQSQESKATTSQQQLLPVTFLYCPIQFLSLGECNVQYNVTRKFLLLPSH